MAVLVINCFHWIGYHITTKLLEHSYHVDGIDDIASSKKEHLSMFVGRNSLFSLKRKGNTQQYKNCIIVDSNTELYNIDAQRLIHVGTRERAIRNENVMMIKAPILFGEWMPMTDKGIYYNNTFIPFESSLFLTQAVYIGDFTSGLLQWIDSSYFPHLINVQSSRSCQDSSLTLENKIYLRDNRPIQQKVEKVSDHYRRFKLFYE